MRVVKKTVKKTVKKAVKIILPVLVTCSSCKKNLAKPLHPCPYKEEINDDCTSLCNCCVTCKRECSRDV